MPNLSFSECYDGILENISSYCEDMFRQYFDSKYQHNIPGLQDIGSSQLLFQVEMKEYLDQKQNWFDSLTVQEKETMALAQTCQDAVQFEPGGAQEVLDDLVYDTCKFEASIDINSQPQEMEEIIRKQYEEIASDVNSEGISGQIEFLIEYGWQTKDIAKEINESLEERFSPGMR